MKSFVGIYTHYRPNQHQNQRFLEFSWITPLDITRDSAKSQMKVHFIKAWYAHIWSVISYVLFYFTFIDNHFNCLLHSLFGLMEFFTVSNPIFPTCILDLIFFEFWSPGS